MTVPSTDDKVPRLSRWHEAPLGVCHAAMRFAITVVNSKHVSICRGPCRGNDPSSVSGPGTLTKEILC